MIIFKQSKYSDLFNRASILNINNCFLNSFHVNKIILILLCTYNYIYQN